MKFNFNEVYQIESGISQKKIYRFKNPDKEGVFVDFSYSCLPFDKKLHKFICKNIFIFSLVFTLFFNP